MNNSNLCSLVLKHSDISTTTTTQTVNNNIGGWSNYKQTVYWNVNLRNLLGDNYNKYEKFGIRLNQWAHVSVAYPTNATLDINHSVMMSGLNWDNSSYSQLNGTNTNKAPLIMIILNASTNSIINYQPNTSVNIFKKSTENVQIQIEHFRLIDDTIIQSTVGLPHGALSFDVFGVE